MRRRRDLERIFAQLLCALFAVIGLLPLVASFAARTSWVREHAATLARDLAREQLELEVRLEVELSVLPPSITARNIEIPSTDGGPAALSVERLRIAPRLFSLLGGRFDAGDVEIDRPRVRLVVADGRPTNVHFKEPPRTQSRPSKKPPFRSLSITE